MLKKLYIHAGLHKTGTTSIQQTLALKENNKLLEQKQFIYPLCWPDNHSIPMYSVFCDNPSEYYIHKAKGYNADDVKKLNEDFLNDVEREVREKKQPYLLISGEDISLLSQDNLYKLKHTFSHMFSQNIEIIIIFYVRHPLSWAVSCIQQYIKSGYCYNEALKKVECDVYSFPRRHIEKFVNVFGKDQINLNVFEEAVKHPFGVVGHFLSKLGFDTNEIREFNIIKSNESISVTSSSIISYINENLPLYTDTGINESRTFGDTVPLERIGGRKFDIPLQDKLKIMKINEIGINWLNQTFGIDYRRNTDIVDSRLYFEITPEILSDIMSAYSEISAPLKKILIDFLNEQLSSATSDKRLLLSHLLNQLNRSL